MVCRRSVGVFSGGVVGGFVVRFFWFGVCVERGNYLNC